MNGKKLLEKIEKLENELKNEKTKNEILHTRMGHLENEYVTFLKNKIEEQNKEESGSDDIKMDEDTLVIDDQTKCSKKTEIANIEVSGNEMETIGDQLYSTFSVIKEEMKNKNLAEAKECLERFRNGVNLIFRNQKFLTYQLKKLLNEFNYECDKIRASKNTVYNYRKCISDNMETFINQIIKMQKNELKQFKANNRKNRNSKH